MTRLSDATLAALPASIARPAYDRAKVATGNVLARDVSWGIAGASLRSPDTRDALNPQDGLYALGVRSGSGEALRVIGSIRGVLVAPENPEALVARMAEPGVRIVSLTVTEKGYCHDPATGELNEAHPDIVHDLAAPRQPRSAPGLIVEALRRRRAAGAKPFTVLCCDNLPANGQTVKRVIARLARLRDADLGALVEGEVACPSTMVDRIVPATTDEDRARINAALGVVDAWPVVSEPFSQWVIEDDFPSGRPAWHDAGAELVRDVAPYEHMKLRLLNASHSALAYLGYLAGYQTIAEAMADPSFVRLVAGLMDEEVTPTLSIPPGADAAAYKRALVERFRNPALKHRTWQIAMDGSQKLPQRLLGTIRDRLAAGAPFDRLALGVAAWMRYVTGIDEKGEPIDVRDPLAPRLRALADEAGPVAERLAAVLLSVREIFGDDLPADRRFTTAVTTALDRLIGAGAKATVRNAVEAARL
jgi:fructuronate reductase